MLDENLPTFLLKPSSDKPKQNASLLFSQHGSEFSPKYSVRHPDPEQHASRNRYAVALSDAYNPEVLYAEVLLIPEWTQPATTTATAATHSEQVPPPPEPVLPDKFVIQLYNPDQQVTVKHKPASWNSAAAWEFELPQQTFRTPSASALDRSQHDPAGSELTPRIGFKWKKDGKLSKDMACFSSGRVLNAADASSRKKSKEPDITVAIFRALKELTLYEPNLTRVEVEDSKGLEVVLLLGALVIRDVYFASMKEAFNLDGSRKASATTAGVSSTTANPAAASPHAPATAIGRSTLGIPVSHSPPLHVPSSSSASAGAGAGAAGGQAGASGGRPPRVPPTDPRSQWEIDAETARLRRLAADEERQRKKREAEQERQVRKMLEAEEREERRRQAEIDKETERLRRLYGTPAQIPGPAGGPAGGPARPLRPHMDPHRRQSALVLSQEATATSALPPPQQSDYRPPQTSWGSYNAGPYMSGSAAAASASTSQAQLARLKNKSTIFGFRRHSDQDSSKLARKRSAVF